MSTCIGIPYWDRRLHCWGAWLANGGGSLGATPLARMRALGVRIQSHHEGDAPMVHEVERETDTMIRALPAARASVLDAYYRRRVTLNAMAMQAEVHPDTMRRHIRDAQKDLQRMLDDRRRGEPRKHGRSLSVRSQDERGRTRTVASVVPD